MADKIIVLELSLAVSSVFVVGLVTVCCTSSLPGGGSALLRLLIPSWRFYEEVGEICELSYRTSSDGVTFGPWLEGLKRPDSKSLILNSEWNGYLACQGLVGQLVHELSQASPITLKEARELASYLMVRRLIEEQIAKTKDLDSVPYSYQFQVCGGQPGVPPEQFLLSSKESFA